MSSSSPATARVAITGIGVISPGAIGTEAFRALLRSGRTAVAEVSQFETSDLRSHRAAMLTDFRPKDFIPVMKMRRMNTLSRLGIAASKLAIEDAAGFELSGPAVGVSVGTAFGPVQTSVEYMQEYVDKGAALAPPQLFAESVANAPGSHIAIERRFEGFNLTFTQRESSALVSMMYAASQIVKGTVRAAISGGVDEISEITFSVLDRIGALARATGETDECARPFDARRNGIILGEGGAMLVLESEASGERKPWAYVSGFGVSRDATASISDWGSDPSAVVRAMTKALDDAGISPGDVDAIWASANSSRRGDELEARALRMLFGSALPPVAAVKGYFGEYAAGGALHLAAAAVAIRDGELPLSAGFEFGETDTVLPVTRERTSVPLRHVLVNSISAGGGIVSAVFSK